MARPGASRARSFQLEGPPEENEAALAQGLAEPGVQTYNNIVPIVDAEET